MKPTKKAVGLGRTTLLIMVRVADYGFDEVGTTAMLQGIQLDRGWSQQIVQLSSKCLWCTCTTTLKHTIFSFAKIGHSTLLNKVKNPLFMGNDKY